MTTRARAAGDGVLAQVPIAIGIIPFGLIAGVAAADEGIGILGAVAYSTLIFAGASQLAVLELLGSGASVVVAVATAYIINARMLMYGASIAPYFADTPLRQRLAGAYVLTDQAYAVSVMRFQTGAYDGVRFWFYFGGAALLWINWQIWTVVGAVVGDTIPDGIPIGFAIPLTFLALLEPAVTDRPTLAAALTAGTIAVVAAPLPNNLGLPLAAVSGIAVGWLLDRRAAGTDTAA